MSDAVQDRQSVDVMGFRISWDFIHGVFLHESRIQVYDRGSLFEVHNRSWFPPDSVQHVNYVTVRHGKVKHWSEHLVTTDRIMVLRGELKVVLFDNREDSPTYKKINEFWLSEKWPTLVVIPLRVCHAVQNVGIGEAAYLNMPTQPYNYESPDKYLHSVESIPYDFED